MMLMSQTAVCNRHHSVEQQLCRWLLLLLDRGNGSEILMTHETIANMLGVRREGITEAACRLAQLGYISYRRGHINYRGRFDRPLHLGFGELGACAYTSCSTASATP